MSDKILDFEQPNEDVIENYEEFDYLTDFYLPFRDHEAKYNSDILKGFWFIGSNTVLFSKKPKPRNS